MKSLLASLFALASISAAHADCATGRWVTPEGQTRKCITAKVDPNPKGACEIKNSKGVISWYRLNESKADCDAQKGVLRVLQDDPE